MPPDPPRSYRFRRAFIRTPLRQILDELLCEGWSSLLCSGLHCVELKVGLREGFKHSLFPTRFSAILQFEEFPLLVSNCTALLTERSWQDETGRRLDPDVCKLSCLPALLQEFPSVSDGSILLAEEVVIPSSHGMRLLVKANFGRITVSKMALPRKGITVHPCVIKKTAHNKTINWRKWSAIEIPTAYDWMVKGIPFTRRGNSCYFLNFRKQAR